MRMLAGLVTTLTASALLLAGCAAEGRSLPDPPPKAEIEAQLKQLHGWYFEHTPGAVAPEAHFEGFVPQADWETVIEECLAEFAVDISVESGSISWTSTSEVEAERYESALYVCFVRFPREDSRILLSSPAERAYLFDYLRQVVEPCVRSAGYDVDPAPSRESYLDQSVWWSPYDKAQPASRWDEFDELRFENLLARCPQLPAGWEER